MDLYLAGKTSRYYIALFEHVRLGNDMDLDYL